MNRNLKTATSAGDDPVLAAYCRADRLDRSARSLAEVRHLLVACDEWALVKRVASLLKAVEVLGQQAGADLAEIERQEAEGATP